MTTSDALVDAIAKIIEPAIFHDYQHPGPLHEIEKMQKTQDELVEGTRAKARQIIALIEERAPPPENVNV
jgi:hypothetical protein